MDRKHLNEIHELQDTEFVMKWYGWGSPVGLSIFLFSIALAVAILKIVFFG